MSLPKHEAQGTPGEERHPAGDLDLPSWLVDLQPPEDAPPPPAVPKVTMVGREPARGHQPPTDRGEHPSPAIAPLVGEEDLPEWLRALGIERSEPTSILEPPTPATPHAPVPTWVDAVSEPMAPPAEAAVEPVNVPPVWAARRVKAPVAETPVVEDEAPVAPPVAAADQVAGTRAPRFDARTIAIVLLLLVIVVAIATGLSVIF